MCCITCTLIHPQLVTVNMVASAKALRIGNKESRFSHVASLIIMQTTVLSEHLPYLTYLWTSGLQKHFVSLCQRHLAFQLSLYTVTKGIITFPPVIIVVNQYHLISCFNFSVVSYCTNRQTSFVIISKCYLNDSHICLITNRVLKCDVIIFSFLAFQQFHDHISVEHDEKHSHTKFDMNCFMVARDMAA